MQNDHTTEASGKTRYDWVFFDYGGTLTAELHQPDAPTLANRTGKALRAWFEAIGEPPAGIDDDMLEQFSALAHARTPGSPTQASLEASSDYYSQWIGHIYASLGIDRPVLRAEREAARAFLVWRQMSSASGRVGPRTRDTLDRLRAMGIRLGVISNNSGYVEDALVIDGVRDCFELVIDSARVGLVKPDWRIFDLAARLTGNARQRFLYVGDSYEADVIGASALGWDVAWIHHAHGRDAPPGGQLHPITSLEELVGLCG